MRKEAEWRFLRLKVYVIHRKAKKRQINEKNLSLLNGILKYNNGEFMLSTLITHINISFMVQRLYRQLEMFHVKQQRGQTLSLPPSPDVGVKEKDMVK